MSNADSPPPLKKKTKNKKQKQKQTMKKNHKKTGAYPGDHVGKIKFNYI